MDKEFTITELESYLNVTDKLINDLARKGNIDKNDLNDKKLCEINDKLRKLHNYRGLIINIIEDKLYEAFDTKNKE
jgi:hypothetical protein